jgi:XFP N-terminal domain
MGQHCLCRTRPHAFTHGTSYPERGATRVRREALMSLVLLVWDNPLSCSRAGCGRSTSPGSMRTHHSPHTPRSTIEGEPLSPDELHDIDAYWGASLYLCMGMLYLKANPLLREPLSLEHIKSRLLGHWGRMPASASPTSTSTG